MIAENPLQPRLERAEYRQPSIVRCASEPAVPLGSDEPAGRGGGNRVQECRRIETLTLVGPCHGSGHVVNGVTIHQGDRRASEAAAGHARPMGSGGAGRLHGHIQLGAGALVVHSQRFVGGVHELARRGELLTAQGTPVLEELHQLAGAVDLSDDVPGALDQLLSVRGALAGGAGGQALQGVRQLLG